MPDSAPDGRDGLFRNDTGENSAPAIQRDQDPGTVHQNEADPIREQEKVRKVEALKPLV